MPKADKFQLRIYAALAEQEARIMAALKAAKSREGGRWGSETTMTRNVAIQQKAAHEARRLMLVLAR